MDTVSDQESVLDTISRVANVHDTLCSDDVKSSVKSLSEIKAYGLDNLFAEHLLYASHLLSMFQCFYCARISV